MEGIKTKLQLIKIWLWSSIWKISAPYVNENDEKQGLKLIQNFRILRKVTKDHAQKNQMKKKNNL